MADSAVELSQPCSHVDDTTLREVQRPTKGCEDCLPIGARWVELRICLSCGHVGCCDSSPNRHATAHFKGTGHPLITSGQPGQSWTWCYVDERGL